MKKNYLFLLLSLLGFLLQANTIFAQDKPLTFKQLESENYYTRMSQALKVRNQVYKYFLRVDGAEALPAELENLQNLQILTLAGNTRNINWTVAVPALARLKNLRFVYFQDSGLTSLPPQIFTLTQLTGLGVMNSRLKQIPADIAKLPKLEYLVIVNNRLSALPVQVTTLKNLKLLILDGNNISAFPPQMANLTKLEEIRLAENPVKSEEMKKLRKTNPKAKIIERYDTPATVAE